MKFSVGLPNAREGIFYPAMGVSPTDILRVAQLAEKLGYYAVWAADFFTPTESMDIPDSKSPNWYEVVVTLSYIAGQTRKVRLGAGMIVLPYRDPVILAKQIATLDQVSNGRLLVGYGIGAYREEFEAIQPRMSKSNRGKMGDEQMEALHLLLSHEHGAVAFKGQYYEFHDVNIHPKPQQNPLPTYISGHAADTPARVARWGTGWSLTGGKFKGKVEELLPHLEREGRKLSDIDRKAVIPLLLASTHEKAIEKYKTSRLAYRMRKRDLQSLLQYAFIGTAEEAAEKAVQIEAEGITHCAMTNIAVNSVEELMEQVQMFGERVLPLFKTK